MIGIRSEDEYLSNCTKRFMPLLDRGFILAFTHRRDAWANYSLRMRDLTDAEVKKQLAVGDFIDCVNYTSAAKLAVLVS